MHALMPRDVVVADMLVMRGAHDDGRDARDIATCADTTICRRFFLPLIADPFACYDYAVSRRHHADFRRQLRSAILPPDAAIARYVITILIVVVAATLLSVYRLHMRQGCLVYTTRRYVV